MSGLRFDLVIFDSDGVLVDSEPIDDRVVAALVAEAGLSITPAEVSRRSKGLSDEDMWAMFEADLGRPLPPEIKRRHGEMTLAAFEAELAPIRGVTHVLEELRSRAIPVCVASSGAGSKMDVTLVATGLAPFFDGAVFSAEEVERGKPAPDLFLHAARRMGVALGRCAVVEDSRPGLLAAIGAGMSAFGYAPPGSDAGLADLPVVTFGEMAELPGLLGL